MTPHIIALLRVLHVVAGAFWLGSVIMVAGFVLPAVRAAGPAGGQVMKLIVQVRRLPFFINTSVVFVLVTGGILIWTMSGGFSGTWLSSGPGIATSFGATLAVATALLGHFVNAPTARRIGKMAAEAAGGPPSAETAATMQRLQLRLLRATQLAAVLLTLAAAAMAAARYV